MSCPNPAHLLLVTRPALSSLYFNFCVCVCNICVIVRIFYITTFSEAPLDFFFLYQVSYFFKNSVLYCVSVRNKFVLDEAERFRDFKDNIFQVA